MQTIISIINNLRIQDVLDIIIVSLMIYALLVWFKERASRFVLVGISVVGAVYVTARFFQLYLTTVVLQGFFAILLFVLVVIFQEDLRRFFERLAIIGRFNKQARSAGPQHEETEVLAATAANLARNHSGALIVLGGDDPLDRHISGGTKLDGLISQALLESIFDPHSPGHDGAVIIYGNRITRFGCHLPLSTNMERIGATGLRHTAALGLAERSDALCIVVSEERGTISIARNERIQALSGAAALQNELETFYREMSPEQGKTSRLSQEIKKNTREKVIALALACILWVVFGYQKESVRRDFLIPIEYLNVSRQYILEDPKLTEAKVILSGPTQAFQLLDPETLKISVKLGDIREGKQAIILTREMVKAPSSLTVVAVIPPEVTITASRFVAVSIPVDVPTTGKPPRGIAVQEISASPSAVRVIVPGVAATQGKIKIQTEPIDLSKIAERTSFAAVLRYPPNVRFEGGKPPTVEVTIKTKKKN
jgi:diadenylate cyclase